MSGDPKGKVWSIYSHEGKSHGWWDGEQKKLSKGDKVTKTYNALKAKATGSAIRIDSEAKVHLV